MFTIAALVHLFGITFYGIFASGELQSWAEPPTQEQTVWSPTKGGYPTAETAFVCILFFSLIFHSSIILFYELLSFVFKISHKKEKFSFKNENFQSCLITFHLKEKIILQISEFFSHHLSE